MIICYDKDEHPIAEGVSASDLARKLGVTPGAVLHGLRREVDKSGGGRMSDGAIIALAIFIPIFAVIIVMSK